MFNLLSLACVTLLDEILHLPFESSPINVTSQPLQRFLISRMIDGGRVVKFGEHLSLKRRMLPNDLPALIIENAML